MTADEAAATGLILVSSDRISKCELKSLKVARQKQSIASCSCTQAQMQEMVVLAGGRRWGYRGVVWDWDERAAKDVFGESSKNRSLPTRTTSEICHCALKKTSITTKSTFPTKRVIGGKYLFSTAYYIIPCSMMLSTSLLPRMNAWHGMARSSWVYNPNQADTLRSTNYRAMKICVRIDRMGKR